MFKVALVHIDEPLPDVPDWVREQIESQRIHFVNRQCTNGSEVVEIAADADVVWVFGGGKVVTADLLPELKRCRAIIRTGSGTDNIPVDEATERGILAVNTPQATFDPVSDHAIGLLFSILRWIPRQDRAIRQGQWVIDDLVWQKPLNGSTLGLIGFGRIAQAMVRKLSGFELHCMAFDPYVPAQAMADLGVLKTEMDDVLSQADFISLHTPLTKETHHLIGEREFGLMKPTATIINTARGHVVDEEAMARALTEGRIAAAALDVCQTKPLASDSPLRQFENVVLTPHIASENEAIIDQFWSFSVEAVCDMAQGRLPASYVNPSAADRCGFQ